MPIRFERPIGASADLKELEYISALHQTCPNQVRQDGSIDASDVRLFLRSRYGILVEEEEVRKTVILGLGGGDSEEEIIDLMEVVSMLLIPTILKATRMEVEETSPLSAPLPTGVVPPEPDLIKKVLKMILEDVTGSSTPPKLDCVLISKIFQAYGEMDLARDTKLHEEMIQAANPLGEDDPTLDLEAFANGLVHDIQEYDIKNEIRCTTNFDDVLLTEATQDISSGREMDPSRELTVEDVEERKKRSTPILTEWTAQAIDGTAGNVRNKYLSVMLSATVIITYFAYWYHRTLVDTSDICPQYVYDYTNPWTSNTGTLACEAGFSILSWLGTFFIFSVFGLFFVGLGSFGNGVGNRSWWKPLLGIFIVVVLVVPAYSSNENVRGEGVLDTASLFLGICSMMLHLGNFVVLFLRPQTLQKFPRLKRILRSSRLADRKDMKAACQEKIGHMVRNALGIHNVEKERLSILGSHFACGLHNFSSNVDSVQIDGGFQWTWTRLFDNSIFDKYGVWFSDRLLSANTAQYIVTIYVLVAGIQFSMYLLDEFSKEGAESFVYNITEFFFDPENIDQDITNDFLTNFTGLLAPYLKGGAGGCREGNVLTVEQLEEACKFSEGYYGCDSNITADYYLCTFAQNQSQLDISQQLALLQASGFNSSTFENATHLAFQEAANSSVESLCPSQEYMIKFPLILGTITAFMTSIYLAVTFLPSVTSTILQLRCGKIPTMSNEDFPKFRAAPDQVSILTGSLFWGCLLSSILVGGFVGFLLFLCLWQATVYFIARVIAIFIGVLAVAIIRIVILTICRCTMYRAMYRERPFSSNISLLALEWANFSLSVAFILVRMIKLVIAACFFIGRLDTPFLAEKVGRLHNFELDNYPTIFLKDLLQHEAHRHPYIELLGVMYLMKLRYRESFGSKAGATWRLLFVYALMPWMHRYRIRVESDAGFLLENTRRRISSVRGILPPPADDEEGSSEFMDDEKHGDSRIFNVAKSTGHKASVHLEEENRILRNQVEQLMHKQKSLLATIRSLNDASKATKPIDSGDEDPQETIPSCPRDDSTVGGGTTPSSTKNEESGKDYDGAC